MNRFLDQYGYEPDFCAFAPARVNLIGEHIDYCGGDVLPMAIAQGTTIWGKANQQSQVRLFSSRAGEMLSFDVISTSTSDSHWEQYVNGVITMLIAEGYLDEASMGGDYYISQNIGSAGLSSSASFCAALVMALGRVNEPDILQRTKLARLCQRVEHEFAGVQCGIMDQMSVFQGHVIRLDCQTLSFEQAEIDFSDIAVVIMDTGAERTLAGSGYNQRVLELEEIARKKGLSGIESIARLDITDTGLSPTLVRRLKHVHSEYQRVQMSYTALQQKNWTLLGELMDASHASLKNDYEVSCEPLDKMVAFAQSHPGVLGARMTGGGFGGCAISLVRRDAVDDMMAGVAAAYQQAVGLTPNLYVAQSGPGASFQRL